MGAVYEARHKGTGRRVAVKVIGGEALTKNAEVVSRFQREAMASGAIESQYIAQVLDTGVDSASGSPYLVMELLTGEDVEHAIERLGALPPDLALRIGAQACLGLQKAHEASVVHRDIKPANLFLTKREGGEVVAKLLDFGIAKVRQGQNVSESGNHALTGTGMMLGSPMYMSPEQAMGRKTIDHRTDIWSLGVVLYEALCGKTPHGHAETVGELVIRICGEPPQLVQERAPWVPPEVAAIVHRAMALDPGARFASAAEMFAAIKARLPNGYALDDAMFVAVSSQSRSLAAPRWQLTSAMRAPAPSFPLGAQSNRDVSVLTTTSTTQGFGQSRATTGETSPAKPSRALPIALAAVAALGVAGAAFFALRGSHPSGPAPTQASAVAVAPATVAATPPAPSPPAPTTASAAAPAEIELPSTPTPAAGATRPTPHSSGARPPVHAPLTASAAPSASAPAHPPAAPAQPPPQPAAAAAYNPLDHL